MAAVFRLFTPDVPPMLTISSKILLSNFNFQNNNNDIEYIWKSFSFFLFAHYQH